MYNEFKIERTSGSEKERESNIVKTNVDNVNNTVRGILLLSNKMPEKKPEEPTEILAWKNYL